MEKSSERADPGAMWEPGWNHQGLVVLLVTFTCSRAIHLEHPNIRRQIQWKDWAQLPNPHLSSTQGLETFFFSSSTHFTIQGTPVASTIDVQCQIEGQQVPSELLASCCKKVQGNSSAKQLGPSGLLTFQSFPEIGKVHFPDFPSEQLMLYDSETPLKLSSSW